MKIKFNYYWLLLLLPAVFICWYFISLKQQQPIRQLPYYGPKYIETTDTSYHSIPDFNFTDQYGAAFTQAQTNNHVYVAEYFFTTCKSICPIMNQNMETVYREFKKDSRVLILSHTVDPETDSVPRLLSYARSHGVSDKRWFFVTGSKPQLYSLARKGYLLDAEEGNGGEEDFIHTQNFALIDRERHIRGYYDGTDSGEVNKMIADIKLLLQYYDYKDHSSN